MIWGSVSVRMENRPIRLNPPKFARLSRRKLTDTGTGTAQMKNFDVEYVADLARIQLTTDEIKTFNSQLGLVLEHVAKLNEIDVSQVEPMAHSFPIYNVFREDEIRESLAREAALSNAPHQAQGLFIVTKVVE